MFDSLDSALRMLGGEENGAFIPSSKIHSMIPVSLIILQTFTGQRFVTPDLLFKVWPSVLTGVVDP